MSVLDPSILDAVEVSPCTGKEANGIATVSSLTTPILENTTQALVNLTPALQDSTPLPTASKVPMAAIESAKTPMAHMPIPSPTTAVLKVPPATRPSIKVPTGSSWHSAAR